MWRNYYSSMSHYNSSLVNPPLYFRAWKNNYIPQKSMGVINNPHPNIIHNMQKRPLAVDADMFKVIYTVFLDFNFELVSQCVKQALVIWRHEVECLFYLPCVHDLIINSVWPSDPYGDMELHLFCIKTSICLFCIEPFSIYTWRTQQSMALSKIHNSGALTMELCLFCIEPSIGLFYIEPSMSLLH